MHTFYLFMDKKTSSKSYSKNCSQTKTGIVLGKTISISIFLIAESNAALMIRATQQSDHLGRTNNFLFIWWEATLY